MPARNIYKQFIEHGYYHVYSRGINKEPVFLDDQDYKMFLGLFKRYLSKESQTDSRGRSYPSLDGEIKLIAYCLMPNHFHAFVFQETPEAMTELLRRVITSYAMYFNKKYNRQGPVFQSRYKASLITDDAYFDHISRYIHLNPKNYANYKYSSYKYYMGGKHADWLDISPVMDSYGSKDKYAAFVADYEGHKDMLDSLKYELADS